VDRSRYARQVILPEIGRAGQEKLAGASVLIVGAGGLGSPAAIYLAAAGVGHLTIADADEVRINNLNRQILFGENDLGQLKVDAAKKRLTEINSNIDLSMMRRINNANVDEVIADKKIDIVLDGTDNFETRYIINDACVNRKIPFVQGSVLGWRGQISVFDSKQGPCYQCLYPEEPPAELAPTCVEAGVIGVTTGIVGVLEAAEVLKLILNEANVLVGKMLLVDLLKTDFRTVEVVKDPKCRCCGN
jgi:adenylyltransferase/sulfurtransferase